MPRRSVYCVALLWLGDVIGIKDLAAQAVTPDSARSGLLRQFNEPARQTLTTGAVPRQRAAEVRALRDRVKSAEARAAAYKVEYHKKYSIAAACIVFVLVGIPLAFRFPGGGLGLVLGAGMVVFLFYYIGLIGGETLANRRIVPPFLAMWISNILMTVIGAFAVWRMSRAGTVSRRAAVVRVAAPPVREPTPT
jgi:lipopolysaccharide export system permease protein